MESEIKTPRKINPRAKVNPLFALFFVYLVPIFRQGYTKGFKEDELYEPLEEHKASLLGDKLESIWLEENKNHKKTALHRALFKLLGFKLCVMGILQLFVELMNLIVMPYAVSGIVEYFGSGPTQVTKNEAYVYACLIIICVFLYCVIFHSALMALMHLGMKARVACCSLVYRKSLRLSHTSLAQTTVGQIVNLLSNDVSKIDNGIFLFHYFWVPPIQAVVATYLLYRVIGIAAFSGMAFLLLFVPLQIYLGKKNSQTRLKTAIRTDERVRIMDEILSGMQAIKMYTWEKPFEKVVSAARRHEIKSIRVHYYLEAIMFSLDTFVARTAIFISIVIFIILGNQIMATIAYTVTIIYGIIRQAITKYFSFGIARTGEIITTINRLQEFLLLEDLHTAEFTKCDFKENQNIESQVLIKSEIQPNDSSTSRIILKSIDAKWLLESKENTLSNINLNIMNEQLVAIIGPVGSGKSSIINVILKELPINNGYLETSGVISYASQQPWLFSASVRQNILFGAPYEEKRYKTILKVCALESDLKLLPYGDRTFVGEHGNSLSGGQKARVNLARCIYKHADIYLLDDPLSAVDTKVGRKLYDECITGFLKDKICVLVTHQLQYLKNADKIIILSKGEIVGNGSFIELQNSGLDFAKLLQEFGNLHEEDAEKKSERKSRQGSEISLSRLDIYDEPDENDNKEKLESGKLKFATYFSYFRTGGNYFVLVLLAFAFLAAQGSGFTSDYFVAYWINLEQDIHQEDNTVNKDEYRTHSFFDRKTIIYTYTGLIITTIVLAISHSIFFFLFFMRASINMHNWIFSKISHATMRFFNSNPTGRILNRFSKDMGIVDEYLPFILYDVVQISFILLGTVTITSIINPWLLIPLTLLVVVFYFLRLVYIKTSRNVKRVEGITRSPIYNHLTATIDGLSTIRAFMAEKVLIKEFDLHQDLHSSAWYLTIASSRGFGCWLDLVCTAFTSFLTISLLSLDKEKYYAGHIGLILTQYLNLNGILQWGMRLLCELENNMTSVERVLEYTQIETEPIRPATSNLPNNWPEFGKIIFKNVSLKYNPNDAPVLKELNFTINAGDKIGVVGRTGAGKSSTISALFQLYDIDGAVIIDNIDTTKIPLNSLRSKISIIPQTPVLFSGTMRKNLDPFEEYNDEVLWNALEAVELKHAIGIYGLNANVSEGGANFSIGQRQLVCLARAIVRNNKILVMDEATANVDPHTDQLIQTTIRRKFANCTVITIAHRLDTVMDSDKVIVMDAGRLVEYEHPYNLLHDTNSIFYSMVQTTGINSAQKLKSVAEESYMKTKEYSEKNA